MADSVRLVSPNALKRNPENPRLIFRREELDALQESIGQQGILVPLTVYEHGKKLTLLDGERRWRCSLKLGLSAVPVIVQPRPDRMQNIMMMFAIHNARRDWDPLPTALKLQELEREFTTRNRKRPTEVELAGLASLSRGEVRRLKKLLSLPESYRQELLQELEKPPSQQRLTVDHVLETTRAAEALRKKNVISAKEEDQLRKALIGKVRSGVSKNTVAPRMLARVARAVGRGEVSRKAARAVSVKLIADPAYSIEDAFRQSVEKPDFEHGTEQLVSRVIARLREHRSRGYRASDRLLTLLGELTAESRRLNGRSGA